MLRGACVLLWRLRNGYSFQLGLVKYSRAVRSLRAEIGTCTKEVILSVASPSPSKPSASQEASSSRNARTSSFSCRRVQALIRRSNYFVSLQHDYKGEEQIENLEIFRDWAHILFKIPYREKEILRESATCIDNLLHRYLDQCFQRIQGAATEYTIREVNPRLFDHLSTGIYAWGRISYEDASAPEKAEALVLKMQRVLLAAQRNRGDVVGEDSTMGESGFLRYAELYSALVYCWSQATSNDAASERALYWFDQMTTKSAFTMKSSVTPKTWNALFRIHVRQRRFHEVTHLVDKYSYLNDGYTYVTLVEGWMNSESPDGRIKAYQYLQKGIDFCLATKDSPALRQLLFQYLSQQPADVSASEQVLKQMVSLQEKNPALEFLETKHFIVVMTGLLHNIPSSHSRRSHEGVHTINDLFQTMVSLYEKKGCLQLKPNYQVLVVVLSALAKKQDLDAVVQCEALLSRIEETLANSDPSFEDIGNHAYNVVLDLYTRVPDLSDRRMRVERLLKRMNEVSQIHKNESMLPDKISFSALLRAIQQEGEAGYASEINRIVREEMERSDRTSMLPDENTYAIMLQAYFESDDRRVISWANHLFARLKSQPNGPVQPDAVMYTLLMKIHSKHGSVEGSERALFSMIRDFEGGNLRCRPTEIEFVSAMISWERSGRSDAPDGALRLFHEMLAQYENGNVDCRPSEKTFGQLLVILAKSNHKSKRKIADSLLETMNRLGIKPDLMIMNFYIRICASVPKSATRRDRMENWDAALGTFLSVRASEWGANSHSYNSILHACGNLLDDDEPSPKRIDAMRSIVAMCVDERKVDERILASLKRFLPPDQYQSLTDLDASRDGQNNMKDIPPARKRKAISREVNKQQ